MAGPSVATVKRLFAVSGNRCAFPGCALPLVDEASGKVTGRICHIKADSPGGQRYDPEQHNRERHGFANLVLMCPLHHDVIDSDGETYTVERLLEIKARHEARYTGGAQPSDDVARQFLLPVHQLPADLADFTGREKEVRELTALLGEGKGGATISAIGGMGGVGKTALAVHVAHQVAAHYPGGQIVVEMGGTSERPLTPVEAMGRVIHAFEPELRLPDDPNEVATFYRTILESRKVLLLLDNAANSAQVRPLVVPAGCGLVVTSRHNISLPGLRHFDLDALPVEEACALLQTIVGQGRATDKELGTIVKLCGRLPLALRVAGDFLVVHPDWSAGEYAQALADERERLTRLKHEDLDVGAALGLSAAQLVRERPDLAARWQMLSVFPAPFERAAAAAV